MFLHVVAFQFTTVYYIPTLLAGFLAEEGPQRKKERNVVFVFVAIFAGAAAAAASGKARWKSLQRPEFVASQLVEANFTAANLMASNFESARLENADLSWAKLSRSNFNKSIE